ncbi:MAG TPA: hypothetical protein DEA32_00400 [Firmicutes bacterium]|nr:hypothetical protein [Bacillota bacterium]
MENSDLLNFARKYPGLVREYEAGQGVFSDRSKMDFDLLIIEGCILEMVCSDDEDKCPTTLLYKPGDFIGHFGRGSAGVSATSGRCLAKTLAIRIPDSEFLSLLAEDEKLSDLFSASIAQMFNRMATKFCNMVNLSPSQRVARFIYKSYERESGESLKITTLQLAQAVSTTRQTVSHVLGDLRKLGIISTSYGRISVLDKERLLNFYQSED